MLNKSSTAANTNIQPGSPSWYVTAMERLVGVVQELSHARDLDTIMVIVRQAARELTGADGATFVLREDNNCYYAEENAISPLWKGKRFPMSMCISGWVMMNAEGVVIEDIYKDPRIPADAYRPTFVKSLAMVPIRRGKPIGAIGNYWAKNRQATPEEMAILQALADTTSVAMENVQLYDQLQNKINELSESNYELSRFAWVASHDLQEPLRTVATQVELLERHTGKTLDEKSLRYIHTASKGAQRLQALISNLLVHAQMEKTEKFRPVALTQVLDEAVKNLQVMLQETGAKLEYGALPFVYGDPVLLTRLFQNLLSNATKFRQADTIPDITIACNQKDDVWVISVADNGIGIEPEYFERIFGLFQRLNPQDQYPGSGIGLATCKKILGLHDGHIWLESQKDKGTTFYFTLPAYKAQ